MDLLDVIFLVVSIGWAAAFYLPKREIIMPLLAVVSLLRALAMLLMRFAFFGIDFYSIVYFLGTISLLGILLPVMIPGWRRWLPTVEKIWCLPFACIVITILYENAPLLRFVGKQPIVILFMLADLMLATGSFFLCAWLRVQAQNEMRSDATVF